MSSHWSFSCRVYLQSLNQMEWWICLIIWSNQLTFRWHSWPRQQTFKHGWLVEFVLMTCERWSTKILQIARKKKECQPTDEKSTFSTVRASTHINQLYSMPIAHTNISVSLTNEKLLMSVARNQVLRETFSPRQHFHVVDFHWVLEELCGAPRENMTITVIDVSLFDTWQITMSEFSFNHYKCLRWWKKEKREIVIFCWSRRISDDFSFSSTHNVVLKTVECLSKAWMNDDVFDRVLFVADELYVDVSGSFAVCRKMPKR